MKILYVTTIAPTMEFFPAHFQMLLDQGHTVELACNCEEPMAESVAKFGFPTHNLSFSRNPLSLGNITAIKQLQKIVSHGKFDIIHCHTPNAAAITRIACRKFRKQGLKVFYTAHGFHFYKGAPLANWLLFYPVEWLCAHFTDTLITINEEDYARAQKRFHAKKVVYVPGVGICLAPFQHNFVDTRALRASFNVPQDGVLLLSVGELNENKNHETVIRALGGLNQDNVYYAIAGEGEKRARLESIAEEVGISQNLRLLGYRTDVRDLYRCADFFVFPSYREGLSVSMMEAMASGKAVACSAIRGNTDLIDEKGGVLFDPHSVPSCRHGIATMLSSDLTQMGRYNQEKITRFSTPYVLECMQAVYGEKDEQL